MDVSLVYLTHKHVQLHLRRGSPPLPPSPLVLPLSLSLSRHNNARQSKAYNVSSQKAINVQLRSTQLARKLTCTAVRASLQWAYWAYWPKMLPSPYWFLAFIAAACACILSYSYCWEAPSMPAAPTFAAPTSNLEFFLANLLSHHRHTTKVRVCFNAVCTITSGVSRLSQL